MKGKDACFCLVYAYIAIIHGKQKEQFARWLKSKNKKCLNIQSIYVLRTINTINKTNWLYFRGIDLTQSDLNNPFSLFKRSN